MTTTLASALAEEIKSRWSVGTFGQFCDEYDYDAASAEELATLIDSRVRPLVEALEDCHPANIWDKARMYYTDPDRAQAIHGQDISKWHKDRCDQVNAVLANETLARREEKPQSVIQQLWNDTPDDKERGVFPGDETVQPAPSADKIEDYDRSIHSNPDAREWGRFFVKTAKELLDKGRTPLELITDEAWMHGWFANAMMAMHDFMQGKRQREQYPSADEGATPETSRLRERVKDYNAAGALIVVLARHATLERQRDAFKAALDLCFSERDAARAERDEAKQWADKCELSQAAWQEKHASELESNDQLRAELAKMKAERDKLMISIFNHGYKAGHHDTVEACYVDIHQTDMDSYHAEIVAELTNQP